MQLVTAQKIATGQIGLTPIADEETVEVRFTPEPAADVAVTLACKASPSAKITYGCVEWFDYQQHPL